MLNVFKVVFYCLEYSSLNYADRNVGKIIISIIFLICGFFHEFFTQLENCDLS